MRNFLDLPSDLRGDLQIFNVPATGNNQFVAWQKPRGLGMCHMVVIAGGGAGGAGGAGSASTSRDGGGGGGSSSLTRVTCPLFFLPDMLYVQVGAGGNASLASAGINSVVSVYPSTAQASNYVGAAIAGNQGSTGAAGGAGASGGTIVGFSTNTLAGMAQMTSVAGQAGAAGGVGNSTGGTTTFPATSILMMGGAGGAGSVAADLAGGVVATYAANSIIGQAVPSAPTAGAGNNGSDGPTLWQPMWFFGGGGGSSSNAGVGAFGGNGSYGAGGGGGGAGVTGGNGGNGGNGLVIIYSW